MKRNVFALVRPIIVTCIVIVVAVAMVASCAGAQAPVAHIAVAARALPRGTVISTNDIVYKDSTVRAAGDSSRVVAGWVTRRLIAAGEPLRAPAVEPPNIVAANQSVDVEWKDQNIELTLRGTASRAGALGDRVSVRTESGRRVEGIVVGPGRVRID
ncbi:MAG: flagellar basal body P-ring formation chaperone FlgA [Gemmatimonadaceae bacterium]